MNDKVINIRKSSKEVWDLLSDLIIHLNVEQEEIDKEFLDRISMALIGEPMDLGSESLNKEFLSKEGLSHEQLCLEKRLIVSSFLLLLKRLEEFQDCEYTIESSMESDWEFHIKNSNGFLTDLYFLLLEMKYHIPSSPPPGHLCGGPNADCDGSCVDWAYYCLDREKQRKRFKRLLR